MGRFRRECTKNMIKIFKFSEDKQSYSGKVIVIGSRDFKQSQDHQFIRLYVNGARIITRLDGWVSGKVITEYSAGSVI